jgi:hypothetical protein
MRYSVFARLGSHIQVVEDPLAGKVGGGEHRIEMHEADGFPVTQGKEEDRFGFAQSRKQKTARCFFIGRLPVKLAVGIE